MKFKECLILSIVLLSFSRTAYSANVGLALKGGFNLSKALGSDVADELKPVIAPVGAIALRVNLIKLFAVQAEVLYSVKGEMTENKGVDIKFIRHYLEIPILLKFTPKINEIIFPNLYAGPALGINTAADITSNGLSTSHVETGIYKDTDFGIAMGAGLDCKFKTNRIVFDVRYTLGVVNIYDIDNDFSYKNGALSVMLGYEFVFGKKK